MGKEVVLASGAKLNISHIDLGDAKALYNAVMFEARTLKITNETELGLDLWSQVLFISQSSKEIDRCVTECMKRCTYKGQKITPDTFEPDEVREDYLSVWMEVAQEALSPFSKNLMRELPRLWGAVVGYLGSKSTTTPT